jgi:Exonuclease
MKYLSFDLEATGLGEHDRIIEFAMIPFCSDTMSFEPALARHYFLRCPSFLELKPKLDKWVIEHNKELIEKAHREGIEIFEFKTQMEIWLSSIEVQNYFSTNPKGKITLFGKSLNAIDLPFLSRDLGFDFMRKNFNHQTMDLSSLVMGLVDMKKLPKECLSGSGLMKHFHFGDVAHNALEDAMNTAKLFFKLLHL